MIQNLELFGGSVILLLVIYDFFYTTLSGSGAGFISKQVAFLSYFLIRKSWGIFGRKVFNYGGMVVNLCVLTVWILLVWFGLYLVFSFNPEAIVSSNGRTATWVERLYYTGYILSTLGIGNFKPVTGFFEVLTSIFSFFGFIFFTSSMTYLISVSSAVISKRMLTRSIGNLGKNPEGMVKKLLSLEKNYYLQQVLNLQEMIDKHSINHQAYPVVHFFSSSKKEACLSLNLTRFDEAVSALLQSGKGFPEELGLLRKALTNFLDLIDEKYGSTLTKGFDENNYQSMPQDLKNVKSKELLHRRILLGGLLRSEGFNWSDV